MNKIDEKTKESKYKLLKDNKNLIIIISCVLAIMLICIVVGVANNKINDITKLSANKNGEQYANAETEGEKNTDNDNINMDCEILEKLETGEYRTKLMFSTEFCIKSVELIDEENFEQNRPENSENQNAMNLEFNATKGNEYNIKITLANSAVIQKKFLVNDYIREENRAPGLPVIHAWPEEYTIKSGRKVELTATSEDPDGDVVTFEWEGRLGELTEYPVGTHTVRVKAKDPYGLESDWVEYTFEVISTPATEVECSLTEPGNSYGTNFNITIPSVSNSATTYLKHGYKTTLRVNGMDELITGGTGTNKEVTLTTKLEPIADGNDIRIVYTIVNNSADTKTVGIATHADIVINGDDDAIITNISGDRGFYMTDGIYNYRAFLRDTPYVTNVDTYWFGDQYEYEYEYEEKNTLWKNREVDIYGDGDSAMAFSWQNRQIGAGQTQEFSFILGVE